MPRQRSDDYYNPREAREKRFRVETNALTSRMRTPSPTPNVATVSRSNRVKAELQAILDSFCCIDHGFLGGDMQQRQSPSLFSYTAVDYQAFGNNTAIGEPTPLLVLMELAEVCEQVWRVGTCAEGKVYTQVRKQYPMDDSRYNPCDLLFPVASSNVHTVRKSNSNGLFGAGLNSSSEEAIFLPASQQQSPPRSPIAVQKCTMHPLTSHVLLTLGGFERTSCGGFVHVRPTPCASQTVDIRVPHEVLDQPCFVRPTVPQNVLNPLQPNGFTTMCALHAACLTLLSERGVKSRAHDTPLTVYLGDADGFGWREDRNTVDSCQQTIVDFVRHTLTAGQDAVFLLWDIMLTDAGLPTLERGVHQAATNGLYHSYATNLCYGSGAAALCVQSVPNGLLAARRQADEEMLAYCAGNYGSSDVTSASPLVSPPHVLLRARIDFGCSMVVMPAGHSGPIVALFYVSRASWSSEGGNANESAMSLRFHCETTSEKSLRYLWWYTHHSALAHFPPNRLQIVVSVGELLTPQQVEMLPSARRDVPRLSVLEAMCCEGYAFTGTEGRKTTAKGCRMLCSAPISSGTTRIRFVDL